MSVNIDLRVYTGNNVLLPGSQVPIPATVLVSTKTGKIIDVREGRHVRADYADIIASDDDRWTDVGDKYLLPGLVEYVTISGTPPCAVQ
jgi:imidazolonepropionase-like amidohydrolase